MVFFLKKIIVFMLPLVCIFAFPATVMYLGKEYVSFDQVIETQKTYPNTLFSYAYNTAPYILYKQSLVEARSPKILALGTSRILEIRKEFFIHQDDFINAGCPCSAKTLEDIAFFIDNIHASSTVRVVIIGIDQEMLYKKSASSIESGYNKIFTPIRSVGLTVRSIYLDYLSHKYSLLDLYRASQKNHDIGLAAVVHHNGFREDGSYQYGEIQLNTHRKKEIETQIEKEVYKIVHTDNVVTDEQKQQLVVNIKKLETVVELAKKKGITIIAFLQPYPEPIYVAMENAHGLQHDLLTTVPENLSSMFRKHDVSFFDFSLPKVFGANNTELIDSLHGTDKMYLKMMIYIGEHTKDLQSYVNVTTLKMMLKNTQKDFLNF